MCLAGSILLQMSRNSNHLRQTSNSQSHLNYNINPCVLYKTKQSRTSPTQARIKRGRAMRFLYMCCSARQGILAAAAQQFCLIWLGTYQSVECVHHIK